MSEPVLQMENVSKSFQGAQGAVRVLEEVSLTVDEGEFVSLVGPSGSGKSTLINIAGGLEMPDRGCISLLGVDIAALAPDRRADAILSGLGMVHQAFHLVPFLTAVENVELPLRLAGVPADKRSARVRECLSAVGLAHRRSHKVTRLSGGEQQRVGIARAIANKPRLILADEPTGNLDAQSTRDIMDVLVALCRETRMGLLLVTHDASVAARADAVVELYECRVGRRRQQSTGTRQVETEGAV